MRRNEMRVEWDRVERGRESKVTRIVIEHIYISLIVYRLYTIVPWLVRFIDQLTNWYVWFNRKRIKVGQILHAHADPSTPVHSSIQLTSPLPPTHTHTHHNHLHHVTGRAGLGGVSPVSAVSVLCTVLDDTNDGSLHSLLHRTHLPGKQWIIHSFSSPFPL